MPSRIMIRTENLIPPGEILLEEFLRPPKISQNKLAMDIRPPRRHESTRSSTAGEDFLFGFPHAGGGQMLRDFAGLGRRIASNQIIFCILLSIYEKYFENNLILRLYFFD